MIDYTVANIHRVAEDFEAKGLDLERRTAMTEERKITIEEPVEEPKVEVNIENPDSDDGSETDEGEEEEDS